MNAKNIEVLIVEDDESLGFVLQRYIELKNYKVNLVRNGVDGFKEILKNKYDLYLIDIGLPQINGLSLLKELRDLNRETPAIIITDRTSIENEIKSFQNGARIFHKKPINYDLLSVQIESLFVGQGKANVIKSKDIFIDSSSKQVFVNNKLVDLSPYEFKLLKLLILSQGKVFDRDEIIRRVFDNTKDVEYGSVDTLVSRLRKKINKYSNESVIDTVYKTGYRLNSRYTSI